MVMIQNTGERIRQEDIDNDSLDPPYALNKRFIERLSQKANDQTSTT